MSEVKRYIVATLPGRMTRDCVEVVKARDYDALKAENARLREALETIVGTTDGTDCNSVAQFALSPQESPK